MKSRYLLLSISSLFLFGLFLTGDAFAATPSFTITPGKIEADLIPGSQTTKQIVIENNLDRDATFQIEFEDVVANTANGVQFLGNAVSESSLKNYLLVPSQTIFVARGQKVVVPVTIALPSTMAGGSLHGAVLVSPIMPSGGSTQARPRLGILALVRVDGERTEEGQLKSFFSNQSLYFTPSPIVLNITHTNTGNTYLNPYGLVTIKNILSRTKEEVVVKPWFVLPGSTRTIELSTNEKSLGLYKATLEQNRGYENIIDNKTIWFIILPWWWIVIFSLVGTSLIIFLLRGRMIQYLHG